MKSFCCLIFVLRMANLTRSVIWSSCPSPMGNSSNSPVNRNPCISAQWNILENFFLDYKIVSWMKRLMRQSLRGLYLRESKVKLLSHLIVLKLRLSIPLVWFSSRKSVAAAAVRPKSANKHVHVTRLTFSEILFFSLKL